MSPPFAPFDDALERATEAVARGLPLHHTGPLPGYSPEVSEPQQVKTSWSASVVGGPPEVDQPGLLGVEREPVSRESFREDCEHTPRVCFVREYHHGVIGVTNQLR